MSVNDRIRAHAENQREQAREVLEEHEPENKEVQEPVKPEITDDIEVEIDGDKITLGELRNGYLRQSDYTKKTMSLAEQRKAYEKELAEAKEYILAINDYYKNNPDKYNEMVEFYNNNGEVTVKDKGDEGKTSVQKAMRNPEYDNQLKKIMQEQEQLKRDVRMREIDNAIAKFKHENQSDDEYVELVMQVANGNFDKSLSVYENLETAHKRLSGVVDRGIKQVEDKTKQKLQAKFSGGSGIERSNAKTDEESLVESLFNKKAQGIL